MVKLDSTEIVKFTVQDVIFVKFYTQSFNF